MARQTVSLRRNADETWTVRVGRAVEHIGATGKSKGELWEAVRCAIRSKGVALQDADLIELMQRAGQR